MTDQERNHTSLSLRSSPEGRTFYSRDEVEEWLRRAVKEAGDKSGRLSTRTYKKWRSENYPSAPSEYSIRKTLKTSWGEAVEKAGGAKAIPSPSYTPCSYSEAKDWLLLAIKEAGTGNRHISRDRYRNWKKERHPNAPSNEALSKSLGVGLSWTKAVEEVVGIEASSGDQIVVDNDSHDLSSPYRGIQHLMNTLGRPPLVSEYNELYASDTTLPSKAELVKLDGSWRNACVRAGIPGGRATLRNGIVKKRSEESLKSAIIACSKDHPGEMITRSLYEKWRARNDYEYPPASTITRRMGFWADICENLGVPNAGKRIPVKRKYKDFIEPIIAASIHFGVDPVDLADTSYIAWRAQERPSAPGLTTIADAEGGWVVAKNKAAERIASGEAEIAAQGELPEGHTEGSVARAMSTAWIRNGTPSLEQDQYDSLRRGNDPSSAEIISWRGSWSDALRYAAIPVDEYHDEDIEHALRQASSTLMMKAISVDAYESLRKRKPALGLPEAEIIIDRFESWQAACSRVGLIGRH